MKGGRKEIVKARRKERKEKGKEGEMGSEGRKVVRKEHCWAAELRRGQQDAVVRVEEGMKKGKEDRWAMEAERTQRKEANLGTKKR